MPRPPQWHRHYTFTNYTHETCLHISSLPCYTVCPYHPSQTINQYIIYYAAYCMKINSVRQWKEIDLYHVQRTFINIINRPSLPNNIIQYHKKSIARGSFIFLSFICIYHCGQSIGVCIHCGNESCVNVVKDKFSTPWNILSLPAIITIITNNRNNIVTSVMYW